MQTIISPEMENKVHFYMFCLVECFANVVLFLDLFSHSAMLNLFFGFSVTYQHKVAHKSEVQRKVYAVSLK